MLRRYWLEGPVQEIVALPFEQATEAFELFAASYQRASHKEEWLQARRREHHVWLSFVLLTAISHSCLY